MVETRAYASSFVTRSVCYPLCRGCPDREAAGAAMMRKVELLWFEGCTNHPAARSMLEEVIAELAPGTPVREIDASNPAIADRLRFPGSPTIRVDGVDVDPTYVDPGDYTPRCRLYRTSTGLRGLPERHWIEDAIRP